MRAFREAVESKNIERAYDLLAEDVVFNSPAVFKPYEGRDAVAMILGAVVEVFEDFAYTDELTGADGTTGLVFRARGSATSSCRAGTTSASVTARSPSSR